MRDFSDLNTAEIAALDEYELAQYAPQGYTMAFLREEWERCKEIIATVSGN